MFWLKKNKLESLSNFPHIRSAALTWPEILISSNAYFLRSYYYCNRSYFLCKFSMGDTSRCYSEVHESADVSSLN